MSDGFMKLLCPICMRKWPDEERAAARSAERPPLPAGDRDDLHRLSGQPGVSGVCPFGDVVREVLREGNHMGGRKQDRQRLCGWYVWPGQCNDAREQLGGNLAMLRPISCGYAVTASAEISRFADAGTVGSYALAAMKWEAQGRSTAPAASLIRRKPRAQERPSSPGSARTLQARLLPHPSRIRHRYRPHLILPRHPGIILHGYI